MFSVTSLLAVAAVLPDFRAFRPLATWILAASLVSSGLVV